MRLRITVKPTGSRFDELRIATDIRRDLWADSSVEIDPDNPLQGTHRDEKGRAYIEFSIGDPDDVARVLQAHGYTERVDMKETQDPLGQPCQNCGNVAGRVLPTVCPNCGFRDVSPCPMCHEEIPRSLYTRIAGDLFRCPHCRNQIRLRFNDPMFLSEGTFNQPLIVTEEA
jgi:hypothetical protein